MTSVAKEFEIVHSIVLRAWIAFQTNETAAQVSSVGPLHAKKNKPLYCPIGENETRVRRRVKSQGTWNKL